MKTTSILAALGALTLTLSFPAHAQTDRPSIPSLINYQGYVTDNAGTPLGNSAPTNFDVQFKLYAVSSGGTPLWAEQQTVTIAAGQFSVLLGNGTPLTPHPNLDALFAPGGTIQQTPQIFLGITVNTAGGSSALELVPRQQIVANPFSLRAKVADMAQTVAAGSINAVALAAGGVTGTAISDGSITGSDLAALSVSSTQLVDGSVTSAKLATAAVSDVKLAANAVTTAKLADGAVTDLKLSDSAVTTAKLTDNAVNSAKLANGTVTNAKLGAAVVSTDKTTFANGTNTVSLFTTSGNAGAVMTMGPSHVQLDVPGTSIYPWRFTERSTGFQMGMQFSPDGYFEMVRNVGDVARARLNSVGNWTSTSDARLKKDIKPATGILSHALQLTPVTYRFKEGNDRVELGFTAQNVEKHFPSLVEKGSDSWTLNYAGLSTVAIGALQEQHAIVTAQGERLAKLEKENAALTARLERLEKALQATAANR